MISLATFAGLAIATALVLNDRYEADIASMRNNSKDMTNIIADSSAFFLLVRDYAGLERHLQNASSQQQILRIQVMDNLGHPLSDIQRKVGETGGTPRTAPEAFQPGSDEFINFSMDNESITVLQPIKSKRLLGWIKVRFSNREIIEKQKLSTRSGLIYALTGLAVSIVLIVLATRRPAKVIGQLAALAHRLPNGRGEKLNTGIFSLETEQLEEGLNSAFRELELMRSRLENEHENLRNVLKHRIKADDELRKLNAGLEQRIADQVELNREKDTLMIQQARFAMMGDMLMNISHQWRQPLNNIGLNVQEMAYLLKSGELLPGQADQYSDKVMKQLTGLSHTIDRFRKLNQSANQPVGLIMPAKLIRETVDLVSGALAEQGIRVTIETAAEAPVRCSPGDFSQCILHILNNARDAIIQNGITEGLIEIKHGLNGTNKNRIRISNNGGQIPAVIFDRIFDPYVTSKFQNQGVGLGLFIVRQTVEKSMQGLIFARNTESGAEFIMEV